MSKLFKTYTVENGEARLTAWGRLRLKNRATSLAYDCCERCSNPGEATAELRRELRGKLGLDPVTILLVIKILVALIQWYFALKANETDQVTPPALDWNTTVAA